MKNRIRKSLVIALAFFSVSVIARENINTETPPPSQKQRQAMKFGADCDPATQSADLDVNNVRTKILNGGDMWWDLNRAQYEIPKIDDLNSVRKHSLFAGAIWIGGEDVGGNLRLAAMTYRQRGSDFWPGPLDPNTGNTNSAVCEEWDRIFKVEGSSIIAHSDEAEANGGNVANPATDIREWPGARFPGDVSAPFKDLNDNGVYEPDLGEYPVLQDECKGVKLENLADDQPDQMLWWIYNDRGNIHSESQGDPIGIEMQTTAFAFATNDEINDMTFYTTRMLNRSFSELNNTYFGQWVDPDLGNYVDDFVGCDVGLSLGFCYNGDDNDEGILGYGLNPPSVGVDFFEGPTVDTVDEFGFPTQVELGLSKFVYFNNNSNQINGNPQIATDFYNYLQGRWRTGTRIEFGGDGVTNTLGTPADYMFPFDTDPAYPDENWNERSAGNTPADRRFVQSSGPFILKPGAVQRLTVGVVWARSSFGGAEGSLGLLKEASKKAQELFNSCFDLIDGPDAPDVEVQELDQQLVFSFGNTNTDRVEKYRDTVLNGLNEEEYYSFQGYRVFQLKDGTVSLSELSDVSRAREVFQCDLSDSFDVLTNQEFQADVSANIPVLKVRGENGGLQHTIAINEDAFATGSNKTLVNFKTYYYIVLSYAAGQSDNRPYLEGRKVQRFSASPRKSETRFSGSEVQSFYGDGPELVRLAGQGNGGNFLRLKPESEAEIVANGFSANPMYENAHGPVSVTVIDPLKVPEGEFELTLLEENITTDKDGIDAEETTWILVKLPSDTIFADTTLAYKNEQVILESTTGDKIFDWGLAVTLEQVDQPGVNAIQDNGFIGWEVEFEDPSSEWLTAIQDQDATQAAQFGMFDWIRSGAQGQNEQFADVSWHDYASGTDALDPSQRYERIWDGRVAPYRLASHNPPSNPVPDRPATFVQGVAFRYNFIQTQGLDNLSSVDLVITRDKSKWSECLMLESGEDAGLNEGGAEKFDLRAGQLTWAGGTLPAGKTIFPGYAINLETGERLNIIVTEDSYQRGENGRDMKWNPTDNTSTVNSLYPSIGGRHYIYIMGNHTGVSNTIHPALGPYDGGNTYYNELVGQTGAQKTAALSRIMQNCDWVVPTYLSPGFTMDEEIDGIPVPPNDFRLSVRVSKPYAYFERTPDVNDGIPKYKFSTADIANKKSAEAGKDAMELINVVPNPYYAFSGYESSPVDNRVKFTNLPQKCDISIYTLDGALVRRIQKDDESTEADWDLKNAAAVPIASGLYIIHVDGGELGEKVLKWMGIMRELDLDSF